VFETFAQIDATVSVVMGVHQSIGMKGIVLFGSTEQKKALSTGSRAGRKLRIRRLTEPNAGSDAYNIESARVREATVSWQVERREALHRNAGKGSVFVTFARTEIDGATVTPPSSSRRGWRVSRPGRATTRWACAVTTCARSISRTSGFLPKTCSANRGEGFRIAMHILNNGRLSLGTGSVGAAEWLLDEAIDHVNSRRQFVDPLPTSSSFRTRSAGWCRTSSGSSRWHTSRPGFVDKGVPDYSIESAICKVARYRVPLVPGEPRAAAEGRRGLHAGPAVRKGACATSGNLPDLRRRNARRCPARVHRLLTGMKPLSDRLVRLAKINFTDPIHLARGAG
jgi:acyl-CoA dehydrogenase family protein 9